MSEKPEFSTPAGFMEPVIIEPERYELHAGPAYHFGLGRRDFLKILGGGLVVILTLSESQAQEAGGGRGFRRGGPVPQEVGAWLHIAGDGTVTAYTGKVEVGQDVRTSLSQAVAEELRVPLKSVQLVMGDTDLTPFDMGTFGSRTTPTMGSLLRKVAAATRGFLVEMAAEQWKVDRASLTVDSGKVTNPQTGQSLEFGQLTLGQAIVKTVPDSVTLSTPDQWKVAGHSATKVNAREIVTGKHQYTPDMKLPEMLHGKIVRPPALNASLVSADISAAESMPGVIAVHDGDFIGVAAPDDLTASLAARAVKAEWKETPQQPSSRELYDYLKTHPAEGRGGERNAGQGSGPVLEGLATAPHKLEQTYNIAYIAHAPLEPRAALAEWKDGKLTVWTGTQRPFGVRGQLAEAFGIPEDRIRVIVPDTGSGYGGKHTGEAAIEAARLAKAARRPVRLVWTREEEFTWAYFRPAGVIQISSGFGEDGKIIAWEAHNYNSGPAGLQTPYAIAHQRHQFHPTLAPLRQGSYRGLASTANHFARETHMDEMAHVLKMDPLEFRLKNLEDPRLRAVFQAAAERFGWGKSPARPGQGFGIAGGSEKGSYVATCAEVQTQPADGKVKVVRLVTAFECGAIVNPDHLKNQIEGAAVMGLGGALSEAIEFENGRILNAHFFDYHVPRFRDVPAIEAVLVDRRDLPSAGAGETPIMNIAPAVGNAIFGATGTRLRSMPMVMPGA